MTNMVAAYQKYDIEEFEEILRCVDAYIYVPGSPAIPGFICIISYSGKFKSYNVGDKILIIPPFSSETTKMR